MKAAPKSSRSLRQSYRQSALILAGSVAALLGGHAAQATTVIWDSNPGTTGAQDGSGTWSVGGLTFWNGTANVATTNNLTTDIAQFGNGDTLASVATVNVATQSITGLIFGATTTNGYTLTNTAASVLSLGASGVTMNSGAQATTLGSSNLSLTLGAAQTWLNSSGSLLTVSGSIANGANLLTVDGTSNTSIGGVLGSGATPTGGLTKNGTGTLTLSGANLFTGAVTVNAGILNLRSSTALGTTAGGLAVASGAALQMQGGITVGDALSIVGGGEAANANSGAIRNLSENNSYTGTITLGGSTRFTSNSGRLTLSAITGTNRNVVLSGAGDIVISGVISTGTGSVNKENFNDGGTGTVTLSGLNTYTGATLISAGTLKLGAAGNATNTPLGTSAGGVAVSAVGTFDLAGFTLGTAEALSLGGTGISGSGALTNSGAAASYSGLLSLTAAASIVASNGNIVLSNTGTIAGATFGLTLDGTAGGSSIAGIIGTTTGTITKNGSGTWTLSGVNTYTGGTTVSAGTLALSGARTVALGAITVGNVNGSTGTLNISNATANTVGIIVGNGDGTAVGIVNQSSGTLTMTSTTQLLVGNGTGTTAGTGGKGTYNLSGGTLTATASASRGVMLGVNDGTTGTFNMTGGNLTLTGVSQLMVGRSDSGNVINTTTLYNQSAGTASVTNLTIGGGVATNSGLNSTFTVTGGSFSATAFNFLAPGDSGVATINIGGTATVTLPAFPTTRGAGTTATLNFNGGILKPTASNASYISGLTNAFLKAGGATIDSNGFEITVPQALLTDTVSTGGGLIKTGLGTLALAGANTYTGGTTVSNGVLSYQNLAAKPATGTTTVGATASLGLGVKAGDAAYFSSTDVDNLFAGNAVDNLANVTLDAASGVAIDTTAGDFTYATDQSASRSLTKVGSNTLTLSGTNNYSGTTTVSAGTLLFSKPAALYNADTTKWTAANLTVGSGATLAVSIGGVNDFSDTQVDTLFTGLSTTNNNGLKAGSSMAFNTANATAPVTYSHGLANSTGTGGGAVGLAKLGAGTLILDQANTFTGGITVGQGTLSLNNTSANQTGAVIIGNTASNADLKLTGTLSGSAGFQVGVGPNANGALNLSSGGTLTSTQADGENNLTFGVGGGGYGALNMTGGTLSTVRLQVGGNSTSSGVGVANISGGTATATGFLIMSRSAGSTGVLTISGGTVKHLTAVGGTATADIGLAFSGGRGELNLLGANLDSSGTSIRMRGAAGTGEATAIVNLNGSSTLTALAFTVFATTGGTTSATLNFNGGTLKGSGASTTFLPSTMSGVYLNSQGGTIDNAAAVTVAARLLAPTGDGVSTVAVTDGGAGYVGAPYVSVTSAGTGSGATAVANMIDDGSGNGTFKVGSITITNPGVDYTGAVSVSLTGGGASVAATPGTVVTAANTGGALTKSGAGTMTINGANTYTGGTTISGGVIQADNSSALGTGPVTISGGLRLSIGSGLTIANAINLGTSAGTSGNGMIVSSAGNVTVSGPISITASPTAGGHFFAAGTSVLNLASTITSTVPVTIRNGNVVLSGGGTGYANLVATGTVSLGTNNGIATTAVLEVATSGVATVDLKGFNQELAGLTRTSATNAASVTSTSGTPTLTLNTSGATPYNYTGTVDGTLAVTKKGAGTQVFSGTNTYSGQTIVEEGTLLVGGSITGSTINVNADGTLGGSGTVGTVNVANGGIVAPGAGVGTLNTGAFNLASTSVLKFELGTPEIVGGATNDLLNVGSLALDGTLQVTPSAGFTAGTYRLFNYTGAFTDNGLDVDSSFLTAYPGSFIDTTTANQINLVVVPEPGSMVSLLGGLGLLLGLRRRRA